MLCLHLIPNPELEGNVFPLDFEGYAARPWEMDSVNEFRASFSLERPRRWKNPAELSEGGPGAYLHVVKHRSDGAGLNCQP